MSASWRRARQRSEHAIHKTRILRAQRWVSTHFSSLRTISDRPLHKSTQTHRHRNGNPNRMGRDTAYRNVQMPRADNGYAKDIRSHRIATDDVRLLALVECKHGRIAIHQEDTKHTVEHTSKSNENHLQDPQSHVGSCAGLEPFLLPVEQEIWRHNADAVTPILSSTDIPAIAGFQASESQPETAKTNSRHVGIQWIPHEGIQENETIGRVAREKPQADIG
jgi:hypothetical protein